MAGKPMLHGRDLSAEQLETIRRDVESFDTIDVVDDEMRALIESQWPHLLAKLRPAKRGARMSGATPAARTAPPSHRARR